MYRVELIAGFTFVFLIFAVVDTRTIEKNVLWNILDVLFHMLDSFRLLKPLNPKVEQFMFDCVAACRRCSVSFHFLQKRAQKTDQRGRAFVSAREDASRCKNDLRIEQEEDEKMM